MNAQSIEAVVNYISDYYLEHGRDYPWRKNRTPFRVYVSEILLQRTRADQVKPVFEKIIEKYPDAGAMLLNFSDVAREMKTLGRFLRLYYFKSGLEFIVKNYAGVLPPEKNKLLMIPGVGNYIAAAIRIFGYGFHDTIIDTNVVRVLCRIYGLHYDEETRRKREFIELAEKHSQQSRCIEYSYGILDFAADICKPAKPLCLNCFLTGYCKYFQEKTK